MKEPWDGAVISPVLGTADTAPTGAWRVIETIEQDWYDGPVCTIEAGSYGDKPPRLAIRLSVRGVGGVDENDDIEYRPTADQVARWLERLQALKAAEGER